MIRTEIVIRAKSNLGLARSMKLALAVNWDRNSGSQIPGELTSTVTALPLSLDSGADVMTPNRLEAALLELATQLVSKGLAVIQKAVESPYAE